MGHNQYVGRSLKVNGSDYRDTYKCTALMAKTISKIAIIEIVEGSDWVSLCFYSGTSSGNPNTFWYSCSLFFPLLNNLSIVDLPTFIAVAAGGNGVVLIDYLLGSFEAKLGAKIASVTSGHNATCIEVMISPLCRWPDLVFHFD